MLCDFGLANLLDDEAFRELATESGFKGTIRWSSPESLMDDCRTTKSDVWSFGWLVWEVCQPVFIQYAHRRGVTPFQILTEKIPFSDVKMEGAVVYKIVQGILPDISTNASVPPIPELHRLVKRCWETDADQRIVISDCLPTLRDIVSRVQSTLVLLPDREENRRCSCL